MARPATGQVVERKLTRGARSYALRFRAYGERHYLTLGNAKEGWSRARAEEELANVLADVRRGIWHPDPEPDTPVEDEPPPSFHRFVTDYIEDRKPEWKPRTLTDWKWAVEVHLLPHFKSHSIDAITIADVDRYRTAKVRERENELVERPLNNTSINKTISKLATILDIAVEYGYLGANPARGRRRRLKPSEVRRTWLAPEHVAALLDNAGRGRPLLATAALAGLRLSELVALTWSDVDLANGRVRVREGKAAAASRTVDMSPALRDELSAHKANTQFALPDEPVFATRIGTAIHPSNVDDRILEPAITAANKKLAEAGRPSIEDVTMHSLRRTFISLVLEAGGTVPYAMQQAGHKNPHVTLTIYAAVIERARDTGERMDALISGADWALTGTNSEGDALEADALRGPPNEKPGLSGGFHEADDGIRTHDLLHGKQTL